MASEGYAQPRFEYADDVARALQWIDDKLVARGELQARCQLEAVERLEHPLAVPATGGSPAPGSGDAGEVVGAPQWSAEAETRGDEVLDVGGVPLGPDIAEEGDHPGSDLLVETDTNELFIRFAQLIDGISVLEGELVIALSIALNLGRHPDLDPIEVVPVAKGAEPGRGRLPLGILKASADVEGRDGFEEEIDPQTVVGVVPCWVAGEGAVCPASSGLLAVFLAGRPRQRSDAVADGHVGP
jgi:hypothetical protein